MIYYHREEENLTANAAETCKFFNKPIKINYKHSLKIKTSVKLVPLKRLCAAS